MDLIGAISTVGRKLRGEYPAGNRLRILPGDVFLVSYPRSGNTWVRFLLGSLLTKRPMDFISVEQVIPDIYMNSNKTMLTLPTPRILKSHEQYDARYGKVIYIVRDIRDVVISYYFWHRKMVPNYSDAFEEYFEKFVSGDLDQCGTWGDHVRNWTDRSDEIKNGFLLVKYEDIKSDPVRESVRIMDFLEIKRNELEIQDAISYASFANMKKIEAQQSSKVSYLAHSNPDISFVRQGSSGSGKVSLSPNQIKILTDTFGDVMRDLNYC